MYYVFLIIIFSIILSRKEINAENVYFAPSLFVNHGGGPNPVLGEEHNLEIADSLKSVKDIVDLKHLKAVIIVTAHWEADVVSISSDIHHDLLYDYNNFPPETYKYKYNASGDPQLATSIYEALIDEGIKARLDNERGWDHGTFIPMMLINPSADIPVIQVSILANEDAEQHYRLGEVLYKFRKQGVAVIGSGMSYHNMTEFKKALKPSDWSIVNEEFDDFLYEVCTGDVEKRKRALVEWQLEPGALQAHPLTEADHLMPLIVNAGSGGRVAAKRIFKSVFLGKFLLSGYIWN